VAERRLRDLMNRHGLPTVQAATEDILDASERRMRAAIAALAPGEYRHVGYLDGNEATPHPLEVHVRLVIGEDSIEADFTGSSAQVAAPLNAGPAIAPTSVMTVVKSFLDPSGPITSGTLRAVKVTTIPGTIVNARSPAPCGGLNEVRFGCDAALMGALGKAIPDRMTGDVRGTSNHTYIGGRGFIFYEYPSGGTGAWATGDGNTAVRAFNEGENVSVQSTEMVERSFPLRIIRQEVRPDSGGPGRQRGGCGLVREVEVLADDARLSVLSDRNIIPPAGVNGGASGAPNRFAVRRDGCLLQPSAFPGKVANFPLRRGDVVVMESSGGGGFGEPTERDRAALSDDLGDGYVTGAGLTAYDTTAPSVHAQATLGLVARCCRLSAALAAQLGASAGDLVELSAPSGPARRVWVEAVDSSLPDDAVAAAFEGAFRIRRLGAGRTT
jgi:N-methylhydantoinase B